MNQHHANLITEFYTAFQNKDWKTMQACYHPEVVFNDPVFQNLNNKEVKAMWHMLIAAGKDLTITFNSVSAQHQSGMCHWEALYTFSKTGRKVHNIIDASFEFNDGKILRHTDQFNFWRWSRMALGPSGWLLGWSDVVHNKVRETARASLSAFISRHPEYL